GGPPRDPCVRQARPVGCGRRVPRGGRKDRRGVGGGRPARLRLRGGRLHPSLARAEVVARAKQRRKTVTGRAFSSGRNQVASQMEPQQAEPKEELLLELRG